VHYYWSEASSQNALERFPDWLDRRCKELTAGGTSEEDASTEPGNESRDFDQEVRRINTKAQRHASLRRWIAETAAFIKHPAFEEETEWRCVLVVDEHDLSMRRDVVDRAVGSKLVPYVNLELTDDADRYLGLRHIVVGPSNDPSAVSHAVDHLTRRIEFRDSFGVFLPFHPLKS
jgi:hypothetical protein